MAIKAKLGKINETSGASGRYITVSGVLDFVPNVILLWCSNMPTTVSGNIVASGIPWGNFSFGASVNLLNRVSVSQRQYNNITTTATTSTNHYSYTLTTCAGSWDFGGLVTSGFRLIADTTITSNTSKITYLALGGDITTAGTGYFYSLTTTGYINKTTSGYYVAGFQPDAVILMTNSYTTINNTVNFVRGGVGWATSSGNQGTVGFYDANAVGTTDSTGYGDDSSLITYINPKQFANNISLHEFHASGFILNQTAASGAAYGYTHISLEGGKYSVGNIITSTGYADIYTPLDFEPEVILFMSAGRPKSSGIITDNDFISFGGVVTSKQESNVIADWSKDNLDFSEVSYADASGVYINVKTHTTQGLMKFKGIYPSGYGFITTMEVPDISENWISYLAIGNTYPTARTIKSAYTKGLQTDKKSAFAYGHDPNGLEIRAYTHGKLENNRSSKSAWCWGGIKTSASQHAYVDFKLPEFNSGVGYFNVDTTKTVGQYMTISGLDFQPKVVLLWWMGGTIPDFSRMYSQSTWPNDESSLNVGFGAATDSTHRFCVVGYTDGQPSITNTFRSQNNTEVMRAYTPSGAIVLDGILDFDSFTSDGFRFIVDDQFNYPFAVGYLALGGNNLQNVYIGNGTLPVATGIFDITDVGFKPDALILTTQAQTDLIQVSDHSLLSFGYTDGTNQSTISLLDVDAATDTITRHYASLNKIYATMNPSTQLIDITGSFVEFIPSGFRLNHTLGDIPYKFNYIALQGGKYKIINYQSGTARNTIYTASGVGFRPNTLITMGTMLGYQGDLSDYDSVEPMSQISMGFTTPFYGQESVGKFSQIAQYFYSGDDYAGAVTYWVLSDMSYINGDYWGLQDVLEFTNDGFTFKMIDYDYAYNISALAIGEGGGQLSSKSAYICGQPISSKSAYTEGTATPVAKTIHYAYTHGRESSESSKSCYMMAGYGFTITQIYMDFNVVTPEASVKHAYVKGAILVSSNQYVYTVGGTTNYQHVYTEGYLPNQTVRHAYLYGAMGDFGPKIWIS